MGPATESCRSISDKQEGDIQSHRSHFVSVNHPVVGQEGVKLFTLSYYGSSLKSHRDRSISGARAYPGYIYQEGKVTKLQVTEEVESDFLDVILQPSS